MTKEQQNREDRTKKQELGRRDRKGETGKTQWAKEPDRITGGDKKRIGAPISSKKRKNVFFEAKPVKKHWPSVVPVQGCPSPGGQKERGGQKGGKNHPFAHGECRPPIGWERYMLPKNSVVPIPLIH